MNSFSILDKKLSDSKILKFSFYHFDFLCIYFPFKVYLFSLFINIILYYLYIYDRFCLLFSVYVFPTSVKLINLRMSSTYYTFFIFVQRNENIGDLVTRYIALFGPIAGAVSCLLHFVFLSDYAIPYRVLLRDSSS